MTLADLCLDTLIYNGHTTGSDMLWAGVPIITRKGDNWPSLVATSLAMSVEMPRMIVNDLQEYEDKAVELALNTFSMTRWKEELKQKRMTAPLFDSGRWMASFEDGLEQAWEAVRPPPGGGERPPGGAIFDIDARDMGMSQRFREVMASSLKGIKAQEGGDEGFGVTTGAPSSTKGGKGKLAKGAGVQKKNRGGGGDHQRVRVGR